MLTNVKIIPKQLQQGCLALRAQLLQPCQPGALLDAHIERIPLGVGYLDDPGCAPIPGALQHLRQLRPCKMSSIPQNQSTWPSISALQGRLCLSRGLIPARGDVSGACRTYRGVRCAAATRTHAQ